MLALLLLFPLAQDPAPVDPTPRLRGIQPQVAVDGEGQVFVVFLDEGQVKVARSLDRGRTLEAPRIAIDANGNARGGMQRGPRIATAPESRVFVSAPLCFDQEQLARRHPIAELWLATSADAGESWGAPVQVNDAARKAPEALHWMVADPEGRVTLAWLDLREQARRQDLAFTTVVGDGTNVKQNRSMLGPLCECCAPGLAVDRDGRVLVAFRDGGSKASRAILFGSLGGKPKRANREDSLVPT